MMTVSAQMMDSQNLRDKDVVDDILFAVSRELWGALPTLRGTTKEAVPGMKRFLRPDEDAVLSEFWAGMLISGCFPNLSGACPCLFPPG